MKGWCWSCRRRRRGRRSEALRRSGFLFFLVASLSLSLSRCFCIVFCFLLSSFLSFAFRSCSFVVLVDLPFLDLTRRLVSSLLDFSTLHFPLSPSVLTYIPPTRAHHPSLPIYLTHSLRLALCNDFASFFVSQTTTTTRAFFFRLSVV